MEFEKYSPSKILWQLVEGEPKLEVMVNSLLKALWKRLTKRRRAKEWEKIWSNVKNIKLIKQPIFQGKGSPENTVKDDNSL